MNKRMSTETNAINWFEIAVSDITRAAKFYETILDVKTTPMEMIGMKMAMFPYEGTNEKVGGALVQSPMHIPSETGAVIYLNANPDMQKIIDRIVPAGGKIAVPRTQISPEIGFMAFFIDTEGNKVALHSSK